MVSPWNNSGRELLIFQVVLEMIRPLEGTERSMLQIVNGRIFSTRTEYLNNVQHQRLVSMVIEGVLNDLEVLSTTTVI